jgi:F0F1-type ATP synthase membrane subunit b/b'
MLASVRKKISASKNQAQKEIDAQISTARKHIQKESEDLAVKIIEKVLYRSSKA